MSFRYGITQAFSNHSNNELAIFWRRCNYQNKKTLKKGDDSTKDVTIIRVILRTSRID